MNRSFFHWAWVLACALATLVPARAANFVVTSSADTDGSSCGTNCTLRQAINAANSAFGADTISFDAALGSVQTITLGGKELLISEDVTVIGPGARLLRVSGNNASRVFNVSGGNVTISGLTISGGKSAQGGGINSEGALSLESCTLSGNTATSTGAEQGGGGVRGGGPLSLSNCTLSGNSASQSGGAILGKEATVLSNCTLASNVAFLGAALWAGNGATITNCTIARNFPVGNSASNAAGGIYVNGLLSMGSTILSNYAGNYASGNGTYSDLGFNLSSDSTGLNNGTTDKINVDAGLDSNGLNDNGGPTNTIALLVGSPAVDAGKSALLTDGRGFKRPFDVNTVANASGGDASDIGAFELNPTQSGPNFEVSTPDDHNDGVCSTDDCTLREAMTAANDAGGAGAITFGQQVFSGRRTISLSLGALPPISYDLSISGPRSAYSGITIKSLTPQTIFAVNSGNVSISNLATTSLYASVYARGGTTLIQNCTFAGANNPDSVGILCQNDATVVTARNCTLTRNGNFGVLNLGGTVSLESCTIAGNRTGIDASYDATVHPRQPVLILSNSIVARNTNSNISGAITDKGFNLCDDNGNGALSASTDKINTDPGLGSGGVQYDFASVPTIGLIAGSPAIDAGSSPLSTDARGVLRPTGAAADIGAFEFNSYPGSLLVTTLADENNGTSDPRFGTGTSLREALAFAGALAGAYGGSSSNSATITFAPGVTGTITLGGREFGMNQNVSIIGPGANLLTISGNNASRVFNISGGTVSISGLTLIGGNARNFYNAGSGGAISSGGNLTVSRCIIAGNTAGYGGALYNSSHSTVTLLDCTLSNNSATESNGQGGGIANDGTLSMSRCTLSNNNTNGIGGGIYNFFESVTLSNCTLSNNNTNGIGGGIYNFFESVTLSNCTLSNNTASQDSGGFFSYGYVVLNNCTLSGNGGVRCASGSSLRINNTILGDAVGASVLDEGWNLTLDGSLTAATDKTASDLRLGPLADNGGPTQTIALLAGSPAIDAGQTTLSTDQRDALRPVGRAPDIGAFEFKNSPPVIASVSITPAQPKTDDTLRAMPVAFDANDDTLAFTFVWKKNAVVLEGQTGATLDLSSAGNGDKGDAISVVVSASDGTVSSSLESSKVTVGNSAPSLTQVTIHRADDPSFPKTLDLLYGFVTATDADGDAVSLSYAWRKNGQLMPSTNSNRLDLANAGNADRGDQLSVVVTASDGTVATSVESAPVTVLNSPPTRFFANIPGNNLFTNSIVHISVTQSTDDDNDVLNTSFEWKKNGVVLNGETGDSLDLGKVGNGDKGDTVSVLVTRDDGHGAVVTAGDSEVIGDSLTVPVSVTLAPASPLTGDVLLATIVGSDADGETPAYSILWNKNGVPLGTATESETSLDLSLPGNGDKGDIITVNVRPRNGLGPVVTSSVTIVNSAPLLMATSFSGRENKVLSAQVIGQDADEDALSYSVVSAPRGGTLTMQRSGAFSYTPKANWNGTDSFSARVTDGEGAASTALFTLNIAPINGVPVGVNDLVKGVEDVPLIIPASTLLRNDLSGEKRGEVDALKIIKIAAPSEFPGTLKLDVTKQTILFVPKANWNGTTSFSYTLRDSGKATATAVVTLQIAPVNDAPVALAGRLTLVSGTLGEVELHGTDVEVDALSFWLSAKPANGTAQVVKADDKWMLRYESKVGFSGTDILSVVARDGKLNSAPATITITVKPNHAPLLLSLSPSRGTFAAGSTVVFEQKVGDAEGTGGLDAVALVVSSSTSAADARGGAALWFDAQSNRFTLSKDDGTTTFAPVELGQTLENSQVKVTLGAGDVTRGSNGTLLLRWHISFKPGFIGLKTLGSRVEDAGGLSAGFSKSGEITLTASAKDVQTAPSSSAPTS